MIHFKDKTAAFLSMYCVWLCLGTVNVTSSDPPFKDDIARFTTVPLNLNLFKLVKDNTVFQSV